MKVLKEELNRHIELLVQGYPVLTICKKDIIDSYLIMEETCENGGKLLIAGNGGSAADSEHIAGG